MLKLDLSGTPIVGSRTTTMELLRLCCFGKGPVIILFALTMAIMCCAYTLSDTFLNDMWTAVPWHMITPVRCVQLCGSHLCAWTV